MPVGTQSGHNLPAMIGIVHQHMDWEQLISGMRQPLNLPTHEDLLNQAFFRRWEWVGLALI
ncbi:hypothetical protein [Deinococcus arenicola]|uniref:hypothetical protein n=1 Tax=Deinococcus arenicola TaxID=2994950 RepID=UPI0032AF099E